MATDLATLAKRLSPAAVRAMWTLSPDPSRFALLVEDAIGEIQALA